MKARHIRRLRKVVAKFEMYIVIPSRGLFGEFCPVTEGKTNLHYFKAESPVRAIRRYQRWYFRKHKEHHKYAFDGPFSETSYEWAKFKVVDMKGVSRYYR